MQWTFYSRVLVTAGEELNSTHLKGCVCTEFHLFVTSAHSEPESFQQPLEKTCRLLELWKTVLQAPCNLDFMELYIKRFGDSYKIPPHKSHGKGMDNRRKLLSMVNVVVIG